MCVHALSYAVVIVEQFVVVIVRFVPCFVNVTPKVVILLQNNKQQKTKKQTQKIKNSVKFARELKQSRKKKLQT